MKNKIYLVIISFLIFSCSSKNVESEIVQNINFDNVIKNQNLSADEKIIDLQILFSKQEDQINKLTSNINSLNFSLDSLKIKNDIVTMNLENKLDSFNTKQSLLIGPKFSNNIIKLYNKVSILEDRAFFMDSLYFGLVTDMVIIENQLTSIINSVEEIDEINSENSKNQNMIDFAYEYKSAYKYYIQGNYKKSIDRFNFLLNNGIDNNLADNCQFWIGQIHFLKSDYDSSIKEFVKVLAYESSNKKINAIYKIGLCHMKLNNKSKAIEYFNKIIDKYPASDYYIKASDLIISLK
jgi:TolA-binding protein